VVGGRHPAKEAPPYIVAQLIGGIAAAGALYVIAIGKAGAEIGGFAQG
jgi:aquaporin Z